MIWPPTTRIPSGELDHVARIKRYPVRAGSVIASSAPHHDQREHAARQDFNPAYVACGSIATLLADATRPVMSAVPPIATELVRRNEVTLCATSGLMRR